MIQRPFSFPARWLTTTGTTLGLLLSLASHGHANTSLQFGQPLPGRPAATTTPAVEASPEVPEPSSSRVTPPRRRSSSTRRRSATAQATQRSRQPAPSATITTGGWDVPPNTAGVYRRPEAVPRQAPSRRTASPQPASALRQPISPTASTGQGYTVYVLGDRLSLLDQVSQITPSAAFTTYNRQTAISAGSFTRSIDAEARVRELSQLGLKGIIAPAAATPQPLLRRHPSYSADPTTPLDPGQLFDNFDSRVPQYGPQTVQAIANRLPIPNHGKTPPSSRKHRRRLPAPPPNFEQQIAHAQSSRPLRPAVSPLFRDTQETSRHNSYHLHIALRDQSPQGLTRRLISLGIPADKVGSAGNSNQLAIGPFRDLPEASRWSRQLRNSGISPQVTQNGWIVESL